MSHLLNTVIILLLVVLIYQDFTQRAVNWLLLFFLILCQFGLTYLMVGIEDLFFNIGINAMLLIFQMLLLTIYFSLRSRHLTNIINKFIGIGDILFFVFLSMAFSPFNFILFFILSLLLILIVYVVVMKGRIKQYKIPLLGNMSIIYLIMLAIEQVSCFDRFDDTQVFTILDLRF
jgi:hypothetical protein